MNFNIKVELDHALVMSTMFLLTLARKMHAKIKHSVMVPGDG